MTHKDFEKILESRLEKIKATLAAKAVEYSPGNDRLHGFKAGAQVSGRTAAQVCVGYMTKHLVSVLDLVQSHADNVVIRADQLDEKIGDLINYLILLEAILREK